MECNLLQKIPSNFSFILSTVSSHYKSSLDLFPLVVSQSRVMEGDSTLYAGRQYVVDLKLLISLRKLTENIYILIVLLSNVVDDFLLLLNSMLDK